MKKAYTLLITLILLVSFFILSKQILENISLGNESIKQKALYIQAKNHLIFLEEYLLSIDLKEIKKLKIDDDFFDIKAEKTKDSSGFFLSVKSFDFNIRVTKKLLIK